MSKMIITILICLVCSVGLVHESWALTEIQKKEIALELAKIFEAAKQVIEDNQALINDPRKGEKGLTGKAVVNLTKKYYNEKASPVFDAQRYPLYDRCQIALFSSIYEVIQRAQFLINKEEGDFKGFISAVFIRQVIDKFNRKMEGRVIANLTASRKLVRNQANWPDNWEHKILKNKFSDEKWIKGEEAFGVSEKKGKEAFRLMIPIYHQQSCLECHGEPKGEVDITGGQKEGAKLGDLAGGISITIF